MGSLVALLTTGGTVSTLTDATTGRSAPALGPAEVSELAAMPGVTISPREFARVPSWTLDPATMAALAVAARDVARDPSVTGVVVTHGTTTLEYSAFLAALTVDGAAPVVFTGAMRRADDPESDGARNLRDAVRVAVSPAARGHGSLVVFAGHVISGRRAWKAQRSDPDAFVGLDGDVGRVIDGRVEFHRGPQRWPVFSGRLDPRVAFVKAVPGATGQLVEVVLDAGAVGLVVEGLPGQGGLPPGMQDEVLAAARRIPVVLASRAPFGRLPDDPSGGTGEPLRGAGLLSAGDLTAEQAWLLLMLALGEGGSDAAVRDRFRASAQADTRSTIL